jgi:hypothetical protein
MNIDFFTIGVGKKWIEIANLSASQFDIMNHCKTQILGNKEMDVLASKNNPKFVIMMQTQFVVTILTLMYSKTK